MHRQVMAIVIQLMLTASAVYAYRPFATEDAGVAPLGENKIEVGLAGNKHTDNVSNFITLMFGIGLGKAELLVETPYCLYGENRGLESLVLAAKLKLFSDTLEKNSFALKIGYEMPDDYFYMSAVTSVEIGIAKVHVQIGSISNFSKEGGMGGVGADVEVFTGFNMIIDNFAEYINGILYHKIITGMIWRVNDALFLDIAVGYCHNYSNNNYKELLGIAGVSLVL